MFENPIGGWLTQKLSLMRFGHQAAGRAIDCDMLTECNKATVV